MKTGRDTEYLTRTVSSLAAEVALPRTSRAATSQHEDRVMGADPEHLYDNENSSKLSWKRRIRHVTWAYFTLTMATGGLANLSNDLSVPYRFYGLETIGVVNFLLDLALYLFVWGLLLTRFYYYPYTFKASFLHPTESLFIPASIVSLETIVINISQYGIDHTGPWLAETISIALTIAEMTPIWIFPAYPMLIIGPLAGVLCGKIEPSKSLPTILVGLTIQGVGFLVSLMVYSAFIYRLMSHKLPKENVRPGMFVSVGPSGFTVAGMINLAFGARRSFPKDFLDNGPVTAAIFTVIVYFSALWLWGLSIFFFLAASFSHWSVIGPRRLHFSMNWFSFVFPNTALITATFAIGRAFSCKAINIVGCVMIFPLVLMYFFVSGMMIRAIALHHILWPQKGEDRDKGGFTISEHEILTREGGITSVH
ncbi:hypothetical protein N7474_010448 [Penicillium riverlandense]|uniref:uncharacterized protein n=1 Tax=Penicillium riverlandense TaxID=1903569 RepID=UPI002546DDF7|nr:uncharacterized protein N7474_010448 [Penicillium riverlandense]KAJ5806856.1 hypothetical protein N7474_010448 [Penicillium riverlandense]